jgi:phosphate-selective porin
MKRFCIIFIFFSIIAFSLKAEGIKFKGLVQTWFSAAEQNLDNSDAYGFTIRRLRLKPYGSFSKDIKWGFQVAWDKQKAKLLDVYIDFLLTKRFNLKIGKFAAPGAMSGTLTSSGKLDLIERSMITQMWNVNTALDSYRAFGAQVYGEFLTGKLYYALMISNAETNAIFTPSIKNTYYTHKNNGLAFWARLEVRPMDDLRFGGFFGSGKEKDTDTNMSSYGAHIFYLKNKINLKLEYIAGEYIAGDLKTKYDGVYAVAGYKIRKFEPTIRYGFYTPNDGEVDKNGVKKYRDISLGVNCFYSKTIKFQANYVIRSESMASNLDKIDNNIFYINCQYSFNY